MNKNIEVYKKDLDRLLDEGTKIILDYARRIKATLPKDLDKIEGLNFQTYYEGWYSEAQIVIKQLLPNRLDDFIKYYKDDKRKDITSINYSISDAILGVKLTRSYETIADEKSAFQKIQQQYNILKGIENRFTSSLYDIKTLLQADIFDSEIETARELHKKGFGRAAGAIAGVIIEKHLSEVCRARKLDIKKKNPSISDFNEFLKNENVIEMPTWRLIQRLGDLRNLCSHNKDKEPTKDDIEDLLSGTDKIIKTVF